MQAIRHIDEKCEVEFNKSQLCNPIYTTTTQNNTQNSQTVRRNKSQTLTGNRALNIEELFRNNTPSHMSTHKNLREYLMKIETSIAEKSRLDNNKENINYQNFVCIDDDYQPKSNSFISQKVSGEFKPNKTNKLCKTIKSKKRLSKKLKMTLKNKCESVGVGSMKHTTQRSKV